MTIKTNSDLQRQYEIENGKINWMDIWGRGKYFSEDYVLWLENRLLAVERAWSGESRERLLKSKAT